MFDMFTCSSIYPTAESRMATHDYNNIQQKLMRYYPYTSYYYACQHHIIRSVKVNINMLV